MKIKEILNSQGHAADALYIVTPAKGIDTYAFTDTVCMAILEYYAFESPADRVTALGNFRILARYTFRSFIYRECGYDPDKRVPDPWRDFHARLIRNNQVPRGYFSVFKEMADIVVDMIRNGCPVDDHTVPDVSVGRTWSIYWDASGFDQKFAQRLKYPHVYPEWFPQAANGPVEAWIYPAQALGEFRNWMDEVYIPEKFPKYVRDKVKKGVFPISSVELLVGALTKPSLPDAPSADRLKMGDGLIANTFDRNERQK